MRRELNRKHYIAGGALLVLFVAALIFGAWQVTERARNDTPLVPGTIATETPRESAYPEDWPSVPVATPEATPGNGAFLDPASVDQSDPLVVAEAFGALMVSWDTSTDEGPWSATSRMGGLLAPEFVEPPTPAGGAGVEWLNAEAHRAYTLPDAGVIGHHIEAPAEDLIFTPTGETVTPVMVDVSYRWQGRDGLTEWPEVAGGTPVAQGGSRAVYVSLVERDGVWLVVDGGAR